MRRFSTALSITDPLVKYQTLVATGIYSPDPAQHRLALHLHKLYLRIKDYAPHVDYRQRLKEVAPLNEPELYDYRRPEEDTGRGGLLALKHHSIWRNPLFKHLLPAREGRETLALIRTPTSYEAAIDVESPKGLFLSGDVGTGKSMLLDLLADGLPTQRKRRWHFNTFMLHAFSQLEKHRQSLPSSLDGQSEYSIAWLATKMVEESPILFLDEFQLPDRAASKLLSYLFIAFFQLGGVLIASSNRMPEELQKASGVDYAPSPANGFMRKLFGASFHPRGELFGSSSDFANFLEVLKARCDFWQMEGSQDWRRKEAFLVNGSPAQNDTAIGGVVSDEVGQMDDSNGPKVPRNYFLSDVSPETWQSRIRQATSTRDLTAIPWGQSVITVYGREVITPRHHQGSVYWEFNDLVRSFGPADYVSMASSYHTFIIDQVPVLTLTMKNEARRFITLLDCLYETRCKLLLRAASPPDNLFFPSKPRKLAVCTEDGDSHDDATYSETIAEVYQDQVSPFRPNVSYYDTESSTSQYNPDQDSDFGLQKQPVQFGNTSAFTGEDERFAYKRAISRLWELCSEQWHSRTGDWWQPLPAEARHWEGGPASRPMRSKIDTPGRDTNEGIGPSVEIEEVAGLAKWRIQYLKQGGSGEKR